MAPTTQVKQHSHGQPDQQPPAAAPTKPLWHARNTPLSNPSQMWPFSQCAALADPLPHRQLAVLCQRPGIDHKPLRWFRINLHSAAVIPPPFRASPGRTRQLPRVSVAIIQSLLVESISRTKPARARPLTRPRAWVKVGTSCVILPGAAATTPLPASASAFPQ